MKHTMLVAATTIALYMVSGAYAAIHENASSDDAAQAAPDSAPEASAAAEQAPADEVIVYGSRRKDRAMDAFERGDYATAEIEFEKNYECANRTRALQEWAYEDAQNASIDNSIGVPSGGAFGGDGGPNNAGRWGANTAPPGYAGSGNQADKIVDRSCDDIAFQLYMRGMSQIKLGKYKEAKENLYRAISLQRGAETFDAHYRIGLLEVQDGNLDKAEKRLATLKVFQKRCERQGDRCDYKDELELEAAILERAIRDARTAAS